MKRFVGRTAVVTGAARGIGEAIAKRLALEGLALAHRVENRSAFKVINAGDGRFFRLERTAARRDHDHWRCDRRAEIGCNGPFALWRPVQRHGHLVHMELRAEGFDLFEQLLRELLAGDRLNGGYVEDRLFRIELGALAARLVKDVDKMASQIEKTQLEEMWVSGKAPWKNW